MNGRRCRRVFGRDTEESIRINSEDFYREHGIEVKLGCRVTSVNPARKSLAMQSGGEFRFEKLIVATGSRVRTLDIPGAQLTRRRNGLSPGKLFLQKDSRTCHTPYWKLQRSLVDRCASPPRRDADNVRTQGEWRWRFRLRTVRPASGDL
jgi:NADPH-dependent 2,4-dienoyl-CoA reductase/sulfur reductase-like enzyme